MSRFQKHIFICENERPADNPRGCCLHKGSSEIKDIFKTRLKELGLNSNMRTNSAGCLDACEHGPVIVIYPEQIWYGGVTKEDVEEIIQDHILNDKPVKRLLIKDRKFNQNAE
ncbi:MAG: (2Fe-2S) ferredoxin domain-containing protein [bacterium]